MKWVVVAMHLNRDYYKVGQRINSKCKERTEPPEEEREFL